MAMLYGDTSVQSPIIIDGVRSGIKVFQVGRSIHNIPVERQWLEVNKVLEKHKSTLEQLDHEGWCQGGSAFKSLEQPSGYNCNPVDLYCVGQTFLPRVLHEVEMLVEGRRLQRKKKSTKNPLVVRGHLRSWERYNAEEGAGCNFGEDILRAAAEVGISSCPKTKDAPYMVDPLDCLGVRAAACKAIRAEYVSAMKPASVKEGYIHYRKATKDMAHC